MSSVKNLSSSHPHGASNDGLMMGNGDHEHVVGALSRVDPDDEHCSSQLRMRTRSMSSRASFILDTQGGPPAETQDEDEEIVDEMMRTGAPAPPDGGYGWVIVLVSFIANFSLDGITCTFGVFLPRIAATFGAGRGQVAWAGSILCGGQLCTGPIVSALTNKFGCRTVCFCGGLIGCLGFSLSAFAPSLPVYLLSYGVLGATGFGLIYLPNIVSVGYYFEKRRAMATGIAVCGAGFGATSFAPLASHLVTVTEWQNVNLMFAGLLLICGICGLLIRPLEVQRDPVDDFAEQEEEFADPKRRPLLYRMAEDKKHLFERNSVAGSEYFMVKLPDGTMERRLKMPVNVDPGVHSNFHLDEFTPHTPIPPISPLQLTTISESERKQRNESEGSGAEGTVDSGVGSKADDTENERPSGGIDIESNRPKAINEDAGVQSFQSKQDELDIAGSHGARSPYKFTRKMSVHENENYGRNGSVNPYGSFAGTSIHTDISHPVAERKYSIRAVPAPVFSRSFSRKDSFSSTVSGRKGVEIGSVEDNAHSLLSKDKDFPTHPSLGAKPSGQSLGSNSSSVHRIIRPLSRKDIFYSGSIKNLPEYTAPDYRQSILNIPREEKEVPDGKPQICPGFPASASRILHVFRNFLDFSLIRNPIFLCLALSGVIGMLGFFVPFVYIIDFCDERAIPNPSILISIVGVMNTVGRVGFGMLSDMPQVNSLYLNNFCIFAMGISVACIPFCYSLAGLIVVFVIFGLALSGFISLTSITLVDLLGLENLTNSFGLLMFFRGIASIVGSPFAGFLYDTTQSYEIPFFVAGAFLTVSSIISSLIPLVSKFAPPKPALQEKTLMSPPYLPDIPEAREPEEEERSGGNYPIQEEQQLFALEEDVAPRPPIAPAPSAPALVGIPA